MDTKTWFLSSSSAPAANCFSLARWRHSGRLLLALILLSAMFGSSAAAAVNDLLELEAVSSEKAKSSLLLDVTRAGTRVVAVGERGHIIFSDNEGDTWKQARVPVMVTLTAVDFPTPEKGWVVGHDGIVLHTEDGGLTWTKQLDGDQANRLLLAQARERLLEKEASVDPSDEEVSEDLQKELEDLRWEVDSAKIAVEEGPWKPFMDVEFFDQNTGFIIGSYGMIFRTEDGGKSWLPWVHRVPNPYLLHLNAFGRTGSGMFMVGEEGTLYRSGDDGMHWESVDSPYQGSFFGVITEPDSDTVVALGLRGNAFYSRDLGQTWETVDIDVNTSLNDGFLFSDGRVVILSSKIFFSPNLEKTFVPLDPPLSIYSAVVKLDRKNMLAVGAGGVARLSIPESLQ